MTAKEYLQQIRKIDILISNKLKEKQRYYELGMNTTSKLTDAKVKSSGNKQKVADAAINCAAIDERVKELELEKQSIISTIEKLPVELYDILHKRYVQLLTMDKIAKSKNYSKSWTEKKLREALEEVESVRKSTGKYG